MDVTTRHQGSVRKQLDSIIAAYMACNRLNPSLEPSHALMEKTWQWEIPYAWRLHEAGDVPLPGLIALKGTRG